MLLWLKIFLNKIKMSVIHTQFGIKKTSGYTMLFAVLVSTVLLSIGIFILNVSKKEVILSAIGRESAIAFYAADGGVECAHYHNKANPSFFNVASNGSTVSGTISCGGSTITVPSTTAVPFSGILPATHQSSVTFLVGGLNTPASCAEVRVITNYKYAEAVPPGPEGNPPGSDASYAFVKTTIESRGYNTCVTTDPRRVERGLRETIQ